MLTTPRILRQSLRNEWLFLAAFLMLGWSAFRFASNGTPMTLGQIGAWFIVALAAWLVVLRVYSLKPGRSLLRIEQRGLTVRLANGDTFYSWSEIGSFRVLEHGRHRIVCFDFSAEGHSKHPTPTLMSSYAEGDRHLPYSYGLNPEALAELLNRSRVEGLGSVEAA